MRKSVTLSNELNQGIRDYCRDNGISHSQLIEKAVTTYLTLYNATKKISESMLSDQSILKDKKRK